MTFDMHGWLKAQSITEVECLVSDIAGIPRRQDPAGPENSPPPPGQGACGFPNMCSGSR